MEVLLTVTVRQTGTECPPVMIPMILREGNLDMNLNCETTRCASIPALRRIKWHSFWMISPMKPRVRASFSLGRNHPYPPAQRSLHTPLHLTPLATIDCVHTFVQAASAVCSVRTTPNTFVAIIL